MTSLNITSVGIVILLNCVSHRLLNFDRAKLATASVARVEAVRTLCCGEAQHRAQSVAAQNPQSYEHNKGILWISHNIVFLSNALIGGPKKSKVQRAQLLSAEDVHGTTSYP